ncbi:MAG: hypothetical protein IJ356_03790 [Erysipelotrichaceae bacterium]|nr:hypothetical protein [Erysipelotrichaceae bacterium]
MSRIHIQLHSEGLTVKKIMDRLKDPKWNYFNLRNYLSLFTGEDITKVEHVFHCFKEEPDQSSDMLLVWVISKEGAYHVYCVSVEEQ